MRWQVHFDNIWTLLAGGNFVAVQNADLVRVAAHVTVHHKRSQLLVLDRVNLVFDHTQDVEPAQGR